MFSLTLYRIETSLPRMVLISTFLDLENQSVIWLRNFLTFSSSSIMPLMVSRIECFMIMRLIRLKHSHFSKLALCSIVLSLVRVGVLGTLDCSVSMPWIMQGAIKPILGSLNLSQQINRYSKTNIDSIENIDIEKQCSYLDLDVPR